MSKAAVDQTFETVSEVNSSLLLHLRNIILPALLRGSAFDCFRRSKEPFQAAPFHGDSSSELLILICCFSACLNLCDPMDCSTSGFAVLHYFPKFAQSHVHWVSDAIHPTISSSVVPFSSHLQSFPASGSFPMSQLFSPSGLSIGASASASVLPMNIQHWSPLGWTGWISLQSKGLLRVFSSTADWKHQFSVLSFLYLKRLGSSK